MLAHRERFHRSACPQKWIQSTRQSYCTTSGQALQAIPIVSGEVFDLGQVKKRADGYIEKKRKINGKVVHFYGKTAREVQRKIDEALENAAKAKEESEVFDVVAEQWWKDYLKRIKAGNARAYHGAYVSILEFFGGYAMAEITPAMIVLWNQKQAAQGKAGSTIRNANSVLNLIFKYWCIQSDNTYNPVAFVDLPRGLKKEERKPPTEEQVAAVKAHPEGFGLCAWLFMYTGCRLGEILALQWQDIDFERNEISITKEVSWVNSQPTIQTPKTKNAIRIVPLLAPLKQELLTRKQKADNYLLGGEAPLKMYEYRRLWLDYCKDLGMVEIDYAAEQGRERKYHKAYGPERKRKPPTTHLYKPAVTAHQFRHEMASAMYEAGIGELETQKILGHADISTTRKIYTHIKERQIKEAEKVLNSYFESKVVEKS